MKQIRPRIYEDEYKMILANREKVGTEQKHHLHNKNTSLKQYKPKVLLLDIETSQMEGKFWDLKINGYIPHHRITKHPFIICYSAKWLFEDGIINDIVTPQEATDRNDERIMNPVWSLLNEADVVIGHNMNKFDRRKLNARFFIHKMLPPSQYKIIDTLIESRKAFAFASHKLDYISQLISNQEKIKTDISLWDGCEAGDPIELAKMQVYCDKDVYLLEDAYLEMRPWIRSHPNLALFVESDGKFAPYICPVCAEEIDQETIKWDYSHTTTISKFKAFRHSCGAFVHTRNSHKVAVIKSVP